MGSRAVSLEQHRLSGLNLTEHHLLYGADSTYSCWNFDAMDTTESGVAGSASIHQPHHHHYHTSVAAAKLILRNAAEGTQRQQQLLKQQAENTASMSSINLRAPRL